MGNAKNRKIISFLNNQGMGLIDIVMTVGLLGLIVAGSSQAVVGLMKSVNQIEAKQDLLELRSLFQSNTLATSLCDSAIAPGGNQQQFDRALASVRSSARRPGQQFQFELNTGQTIARGQKISGFVVDDFFLYDAQHVTSISGGGNRYLVSAVGVFAIDGKVSGPQKFTKSMGNFFIDVDSSDDITSCNAMGNNSSGTSSSQSNCQCDRNSPAVTSGSPQCSKQVYSSGETVSLFCNAGGRGSSLCVNGRWTNVPDCPRDQR